MASFNNCWLRALMQGQSFKELAVFVRFAAEWLEKENVMVFE